MINSKYLYTLFEFVKKSIFENLFKMEKLKQNKALLIRYMLKRAKAFIVYSRRKN